jgi:uncharacterized repeat protein (TIGR03803 family)
MVLAMFTAVAAALTLASNAASSQASGDPDDATAGETAVLPLAGAAGSQLGGEPDGASAYQILHLFMAAHGPVGNLIFDSAGNLYGTTSEGGAVGGPCLAHGCGTVWKLAPNAKGSWEVRILHNFTGADGAAPLAGPVLDRAGNLYGTTSSGGSGACAGVLESETGCGVVFKLARNAKGIWTETVIHTFTGGADGATPMAGLILDAAGNLYGTTFAGGDVTACPFAPVGCGVVFKLAPNPDGTWTENVLHSFNNGDGGLRPQAGLIFDTAGNLYGTTPFATDAAGVVFKLAPNPDGTWTESVIHSFSFTAPRDGAQPQAGLISDAAGNLYGTTSAGGAKACAGLAGCGVVFKLALNPDGTWTESVLHRFTGANGTYPSTGLVLDAAGNLYGMTDSTVFERKPNPDGTWSGSVLHSFTGTDGLGPDSGLVFDAAGNLYGTTFGGGAGCGTMSAKRIGGCGVVFKLTP